MPNFSKLIALVIAVVGFGGNAQAQFKHPKELSLVRSVWVVIEDDAKDGCLPNPNVLKVEAELTLRRAGIGVTSDRRQSGFSLEFYIAGLEIKREVNKTGTGTCAVFIDIQLYRAAKVSEGHSAIVDSYTNGTLLIHSKDDLQNELRKTVSEFTSDLANEILKARGK